LVKYSMNYVDPRRAIAAGKSCVHFGAAVSSKLVILISEPESLMTLHLDVRQRRA
jgi:hypothetical protein